MTVVMKITLCQINIYYTVYAMKVGKREVASVLEEEDGML